MISKTLTDIAEICGYQAAIELARNFGGRNLIVPLPLNLKETHPIALCIGLTGARRLANHRGGEQLQIPMEINAVIELRNAAIVDAFDQGGSIRAIGFDFGLSRRWIRHVLERCGRAEQLAAREAARNQSHLTESAADD